MLRNPLVEAILLRAGGSDLFLDPCARAMEARSIFSDDLIQPHNIIRICASTKY